MNKAILVGRLGRDPEIYYSQDGKAVVKLNVATSEYYNKESHTEWHKCVAFSKTAEYCDNYLAKGDLVSIIGKLHTRNYVDKNGKTCYVTEIIIDKINKLTSSSSSVNEKEGNNFSNIDEDDIPF